MSVNKGKVHIHAGISCSHEKQLPANCSVQHWSKAGEEYGRSTVKVMATEGTHSFSLDAEDTEIVSDSAFRGSVSSSNGDAGKKSREG